ncbi:alpha/beta hydrolase [Vibrio mangrovi]|uniref:Alpha/beta hydrolase n=1 Tax=Vibrio mangrovi TaxID=474394 RepID=A0A1Y6IWR1_9VIBR|nr:alpha/beta hydrolase [Vibrio mangrovi]MDW6005464.1 alpha/beta hydrolase [Vibrio mangrovi]SMS02094.1 Alpha/beta hydrolase family protein [Vibrio mangrovi]
MPRTLTGKLFNLPFLILLSSCTTAVNKSPEDLTATTARGDGTFIHWQLNAISSDTSQPLLLVAQGSGCLPTRANKNIELLRRVLPEYAILTIEKYGVNPEVIPKDPMNSCSSEFYANHTVTRRVEDARLVLHDLQARNLWHGNLILFGGSEGGAVVSILSHEIDAVDAVVVFSTGTGMTMAEFFPQIVPPPVAKQMQAVFEQARANPMSQEIVGGNSLRWWADILDRRLSDDLLKSSVPVLLIHGENDRHAPVAAARATQSAFAFAGESEHLTYWELPHRDHQMRDEEGKSHLETVFDQVAAWIRTQMY